MHATRRKFYKPNDFAGPELGAVSAKHSPADITVKLADDHNGPEADVEALAAFRTSDEESDQQDRRSVEGGNASTLARADLIVARMTHCQGFTNR